jgi:PAS domain S-box-containing protein
LGRFGIAGALAGAAMVLVLGGLLVVAGEFESAGRDSLRSARVLELAATSERLTVNAETSTRAYLLTGRPQYAHEARTAYSQAQDALAKLELAVAGSTQERARVGSIATTTTQLGRSWLFPSLAQRVRSPRPYLAFAKGEQIRLQLERRYDPVVAAEQSLETQRLARVHRLHGRVWWAAIAAMLAIPALLTAFLVYTGLVLLRPVRAVVDLAGRVEQGEEGATGDVGGPREIAQLQDAFNRMSSRVGQRRREILDHAPIAIWEVVGGEIRWISPQWREMAGEGAEEPRTVADIDAVAHPEDREHIAEVRREGIASGEPFDYRFRILRPDGQTRWLWTRAKPVGADGGEPRFIGFTLDVTDDERTRQELAHAQRLESVGHLAGGVAHDFNNLLTVISGYATLAQMRLDDPSRLEAPLKEIVGAAQRASALTRQLLMFGRKQDFEVQTLDLNAVVRSVVPMLERLIEERIVLLCSLADGVPVIRFDAGQLEQVIVNLAVNARDAIRGNGRIVISTSADGEGATRTVRLSVADDGSGIDEATLEHIFDPFFTTKPPGQGTGLGLSTVHGIVARGGGHIEVDSRPGEGTTFTVVLPAASDSSGALTVAA